MTVFRKTNYIFDAVNH